MEICASKRKYFSHQSRKSIIQFLVSLNLPVYSKNSKVSFIHYKGPRNINPSCKCSHFWWKSELTENSERSKMVLQVLSVTMKDWRMKVNAFQIKSCKDWGVKVKMSTLKTWSSRHSFKLLTGILVHMTWYKIWKKKDLLIWWQRWINHKTQPEKRSIAQLTLSKILIKPVLTHKGFSSLFNWIGMQGPYSLVGSKQIQTG